MTDSKESMRSIGSEFENLVAGYLGWKVISGSGSRPGLPGDLSSDDWLGECKTHCTAHQPISFKFSVLNKICTEAFSRHKYPVLFVNDGSQTIDGTWCMFPLRVFPKSIPNRCEVPTFVNRSSVGFDCDIGYQVYNSRIGEKNLGVFIVGIYLPKKTEYGICPLEVFKQFLEA